MLHAHCCLHAVHAVVAAGRRSPRCLMRWWRMWSCLPPRRGGLGVHGLPGTSVAALSACSLRPVCDACSRCLWVAQMCRTCAALLLPLLLPGPAQTPDVAPCACPCSGDKTEAIERRLELLEREEEMIKEEEAVREGGTASTAVLHELYCSWELAGFSRAFRTPPRLAARAHPHPPSLSHTSCCRRSPRSCP